MDRNLLILVLCHRHFHMKFFFMSLWYYNLPLAHGESTYGIESILSTYYHGSILTSLDIISLWGLVLGSCALPLTLFSSSLHQSQMRCESLSSSNSNGIVAPTLTANRSKDQVSISHVFMVAKAKVGCET